MRNERHVPSRSLDSKLVIHHRERGIYLGSFLGLGIWSKLDPAGQDSAVTFESIYEAESHMASWDEGRPPEVALRRVCADLGYYASIGACAAAGLEPWSPRSLESLDIERA